MIPIPCKAIEEIWLIGKDTNDAYRLAPLPGSDGHEAPGLIDELI